MRIIPLSLTLAATACVFPSRSQTTAPDAQDSAAMATTAADEPAPASHWRLIASPYTLHYHYDPDHRSVYMLGIERQRADGLVLGWAGFRNSFGQPSMYLYAGHSFRDFTSYKPLYAQLTAGLLYGYKPPFDDKVPFNHNGFSPGAVLSAGWQFTPAYSVQLNFLGDSAVMLQFSVDLP
jgi:hypothetical protein